jgi:hypothetical protein
MFRESRHRTFGRQSFLSRTYGRDSTADIAGPPGLALVTVLSRRCGRRPTSSRLSNGVENGRNGRLSRDAGSAEHGSPEGDVVVGEEAVA